MNPTVDDIRAIKPGRTKAFVCADMKECLSAKSKTTYVKYMGLPDGVGGYTVSIDREQLIISITAIRKK